MTSDKLTVGAKAGKIDTSGFAFPKTAGRKIFLEKVCGACGAKYEKGSTDHPMHGFPGKRCDGKKRTQLKTISEHRAKVEQPNKNNAYNVAKRRDQSQDGKTYCQITLALTGECIPYECHDHVDKQNDDKPGKTEVDNLLSASAFVNINRDKLYTATREITDAGSTITLIGKKGGKFEGLSARRDQWGLKTSPWERF